MIVATIGLSGNAHDRRVELRPRMKEMLEVHPNATFKRRKPGRIEVHIPDTPRVKARKARHKRKQR